MKMRILFTGGGTLGPVTPLLAIYETWRKEIDASWIGTPAGPEAELVHSYRMPFYPLSTPKLDRHKVWKWPFIPAHMAWSLWKSFWLLRKLKPQMVFTAGGYVSIPVVFTAWMLRVPVWVHQLDVTPGVANKLMAPFAKRVSVTWESSLKDFSEKRTLVVGSVVRPSLMKGTKKEAREEFSLDASKKTVLVLGGGTGSADINQTMLAIAEQVAEKANVIHLTGQGKMLEELSHVHHRYNAVPLLNKKMAHALAAADVIVSRAGMGTILEIAALQKPAILIPLEGHQMVNAATLEDHDAVEVIRRLNPQILFQRISHLIDDDERCEELSKHLAALLPAQGASQIVSYAKELLQ